MNNTKTYNVMKQRVSFGNYIRESVVCLKSINIYIMAIDQESNGQGLKYSSFVINGGIFQKMNDFGAHFKILPQRKRKLIQAIISFLRNT
jgi:hypothetical protein